MSDESKKADEAKPPFMASVCTALDACRAEGYAMIAIVVKDNTIAIKSNVVDINYLRFLLDTVHERHRDSDLRPALAMPPLSTDN